jgi:hypothetical protein
MTEWIGCSRFVLEGIIHANGDHYYWCLGYLRRWVEMQEDRLNALAVAGEVWRKVQGDNAYTQRDFQAKVVEKVWAEDEA